MVTLADAARREGPCTTSTLAALCSRDGFRWRFRLGLYRFHVRDASGLIDGEEGIVLPDLYAALAEALHSVQELMEDAPDLAGMQFEITDEKGRLVLKVPIYATSDGRPHKGQAQAA